MDEADERWYRAVIYSADRMLPLAVVHLCDEEHELLCARRRIRVHVPEEFPAPGWIEDGQTTFPDRSVEVWAERIWLNGLSTLLLFTKDENLDSGRANGHSMVTQKKTARRSGP